MNRHLIIGAIAIALGAGIFAAVAAWALHMAGVA